VFEIYSVEGTEIEHMVFFNLQINSFETKELFLISKISLVECEKFSFCKTA